MRDISTNPEAMRELVEVHKSRGTPTLIIGGKVLTGFEKEKVDAALAESE